MINNVTTTAVDSVDPAAGFDGDTSEVAGARRAGEEGCPTH